MRVFLLLLLSVAGCDAASVLAGPDPTTGIIPTVVVSELDPNDWKTDPLDIAEYLISADALTLHVRYGGGCKPHSFAFVVSSDFVERLESGRGPAVQTEGLVLHLAHGDLCERLVQDTLVAELTALKGAYQAAFETDSGAIVMVFDPETQVRYEF
jgi:hypothetical protein